MRRPEAALVIAGPTASGKSAVSMLLAKALGGEIVSADSMQIYRGMDIGTAKASPADRAMIRHHMIDICDPGESYSVAQYQTAATDAVLDIMARGRQPVICGGTGQYLTALIEGLTYSPAPADPDLRIMLEEQAEREGLAILWEQLMEADPLTASRISCHDRKRIIRALEIFQLTGQPMSWHDARSRRHKPSFPTIGYCLAPDRNILYQRINQRVLQMIDDGLADEIRQLAAMQLPAGSTCLQAIGYKEMTLWLAGQDTLDQAIEKIQQASRRYAKRQLTWFRKMTDLIWLNQTDPAVNAQSILENLKNIDYIQ